MDNKIIAIVVTYNRKNLLKECIYSLINQNYKDLQILIVDNASTDGTQDFIKVFIDNKKVFYSNTGSNLGGAGGFNYGIKKAIEMDCDYVWVMDDDCIVNKDSLTALIDFAQSINNNFGYLSSVVKWTDGNICKMNTQSFDVRKPVTDFNKNQKIRMATFVSLLINISAVEDVGLPIKEFFIWGDDVEYTYRLSKKYDCYLVANSVVTHKSINNVGSNIVKDDSFRLDRYFYAYRNECYLYRKMGLKGAIFKFLRFSLHISRVIFSKCNCKRKRLGIIFKGIKAGKHFKPKTEFCVRSSKPINVLEFFSDPLNYAGQDTFMLNMYKNFKDANIKYTICTPFTCINQSLQKQIELKNDSLKCNNKLFNSKKRKYIKSYAKQIIKSNHFDVVHIQSGSIYALLNVAKIAKKAGVKKVIVHSHSTGKNNLKYKVIKFLSDRQINKYADVYLACSDLAAKWKFPKKIIAEHRYQVINNGIDIKKFTFNEKIRQQYRKELNLGSALTLCNVGRFEEQKNHAFILEIAKILKEKNVDFKFVLVGDGELKEKFIDNLKRNNLFDKFILLEKRNDVAEIMMACDIFVFPSLFEGLGIVAIESQCTGLLTLCSQNIPKEAKITELVKTINLNKIDKWISQICSFSATTERKNYAAIIDNAGFNSEQSAQLLEKIYRGQNE